MGRSRSSTGIAICSLPSTSKGSPWRGDELRAVGDLRRRGPRSRRGPGVRARRAAVRRRRRRHDRDPQQERRARPRVAGVGARHRQRAGRERARWRAARSTASGAANVRRCCSATARSSAWRCPTGATGSAPATGSSARRRDPRAGGPRDGLRAQGRRGGGGRPALPVLADRARSRVGGRTSPRSTTRRRRSSGTPAPISGGTRCRSCRTTWSGRSRR